MLDDLSFWSAQVSSWRWSPCLEPATTSTLMRPSAWQRSSMSFCRGRCSDGLFSQCRIRVRATGMNQGCSPARLILICGLPGSGKTTLAKSLAGSRSALRLCPDEWQAALGFDRFDDPLMTASSCSCGNRPRTY